MKQKWVFGIVLGWAIFLGSFPAPGSAEPLSLEEALLLARQHNPKVKMARQEVASAKGRRTQARGLPDAEASFDLGGLKKGAAGHRDANLDQFSFLQPLEAPGSRLLLAQAAHEEVQLAEASLNRVWIEVKRDLKVAYAQVLAWQKALETANENLNATRQFLTAVQTRFQAGTALRSDLIRARIEVSRAEREVLVAQKEVEVWKGKFNLLMGREAREPLDLAGQLQHAFLSFNYETLLKKARSKRSDLQAQTKRVSANRKNLWSERIKTFLPSLGIGFERTREDYEDDNTILFEASYPLWTLNSGKRREAAAELKKEEIQLNWRELEVGFQVYQAWFEFDLAEKQVELRKRELEESTELLRQTTLQYQEGEIEFLKYLENLAAIRETRLGYFQALEEYQEKLADLEMAVEEDLTAKEELK